MPSCCSGYWWAPIRGQLMARRNSVSLVLAGVEETRAPACKGIILQVQGCTSCASGTQNCQMCGPSAGKDRNSFAVSFRVRLWIQAGWHTGALRSQVFAVSVSGQHFHRSSRSRTFCSLQTILQSQRPNGTGSQLPGLSCASTTARSTGRPPPML